MLTSLQRDVLFWLEYSKVSKLFHRAEIHLIICHLPQYKDRNFDFFILISVGAESHCLAERQKCNLYLLNEATHVETRPLKPIDIRCQEISLLCIKYRTINISSISLLRALGCSFAARVLF